MVLVGKKNNINDKLIGEISDVFPIGLIEPDRLLSEDERPTNFSPPVILVNLLDMDTNQTNLVKVVRAQNPGVKIVALHAFKVESMIQATLKSGFDGYISVFDLSTEFIPLLTKLGVI
jgi:AmiR/NasT family two-component response regulator